MKNFLAYTFIMGLLYVMMNIFLIAGGCSCSGDCITFTKTAFIISIIAGVFYMVLYIKDIKKH